MNDDLVAFKENALHVTPSLWKPADILAGSVLPLLFTSTTPNATMYVVAGVPTSPTLVPGYLYSLQTTLTLVFPVLTNAQRTYVLPVPLTILPAGVDVSIQGAEIQGVVPRLPHEPGDDPGPLAWSG